MARNNRDLNLVSTKTKRTMTQHSRSFITPRYSTTASSLASVTVSLSITYQYETFGGRILIFFNSVSLLGELNKRLKGIDCSSHPSLTDIITYHHELLQIRILITNFQRFFLKIYENLVLYQKCPASDCSNVAVHCLFQPASKGRLNTITRLLFFALAPYRLF